MRNTIAALMTKMSGSALSTSVGGRIFLDSAPEGTAFPYLTFSIVTSNQRDTFKNSLEETLIQFSLFSTSEGATEITGIYDNLITLFDWSTFTITGNTQIWMKRENLLTSYEYITTPQGTVGVRFWSVDYSIMREKT